MSKMSKAIAALGVVAGLGVAALPLSTYAAIPSGDSIYKTSTSAQVEVIVEGAISISSNIDEVGTDGVIKLGEIMPGSITTETANAEALKVTVESNTNGAQFDLYMNTLEADGALTGANTGAKINGGRPTAGTSAWGYKRSTDGTTWSGDYAAVPTPGASTPINSNTKLETAGANAGTGVKAKNENYFKFQASAAASQTADTYNGTVVFTAVVTN